MEWRFETQNCPWPFNRCHRKSTNQITVVFFCFLFFAVVWFLCLFLCFLEGVSGRWFCIRHAFDLFFLEVTVNHITSQLFFCHWLLAGLESNKWLIWSKCFRRTIYTFVLVSFLPKFIFLSLYFFLLFDLLLIDVILLVYGIFYKLP